jgi:hypothetical protein
MVFLRHSVSELVTWSRWNPDASARGQGAAYIVLRGRRAQQDQADLNMWFRFIIIGGGGSFRKLGAFGTRGCRSAPPPGRSGWGGCWGGPKNRRKSLNTEVQNSNHTSHERCKKETKNLRKYALSSKVVNPFTRALAPPFIGRRREFLHSENTLESREYSLCEHIQKCLLHLVICGADFIHLEAYH